MPSLAPRERRAKPLHAPPVPEQPELPRRQPPPNAPEQAEPAPPTRHVARPRRCTPFSEPPIDPIDPVDYRAWLRCRTEDERARIAAHCSRRLVTFDRLCGGIGPLHVPMPPYLRVAVLLRPPGPERDKIYSPKWFYPTWEEWRAALTPRQRAYIRWHCRGGDGRPSSDLCGPNTPLVIAFFNEPVAFSAGGAFAFSPGAPTPTDFPTASTPWLALDRDRNGAIDSGAELFGSDTVLPSGATASNGFVALSALDTNGDGRIDALDPGFAELLLWADRDGDRKSSPDELRPASGQLISLSLAHWVEPRCDARGNCEGERAVAVWRDANGEQHEGAVVDVYLPRR